MIVHLLSIFAKFFLTVYPLRVIHRAGHAQQLLRQSDTVFQGQKIIACHMTDKYIGWETPPCLRAVNNFRILTCHRRSIMLSLWRNFSESLHKIPSQSRLKQMQRYTYSYTYSETMDISICLVSGPDIYCKINVLKIQTCIPVWSVAALTGSVFIGKDSDYFFHRVRGPFWAFVRSITRKKSYLQLLN